ncbi:PQQ-binding-like beta-propeller repeat protein [Actinoplanes sp. NPDC023801]|uniref:outer membrane protein assembly factor BamB family protein n=1 Tax=Actinoplanes sp. NPDC023801 TaxID=3154595 RepID=UPI003410F021
MNRVLLRIMAAALLLVVSGLIGWRVLAPAELSASARTPNPPTPSAVLLGVTSRLNIAPLIVDGRVRVYAAKHQVKADGPVTARTVYTARWSFRRWPQQLSAVVASGTTVVTRWSDGKLVAIDARTGKVTWRADGPAAPGYAGHRTGAAAVWNPPGLRLAGGTLVVTEGQSLSGYAVSNGRPIWAATVPAGCSGGLTTSGGAYLCATGVYEATSGVPLTGWPAGPYTPVGCVTSGCDAVRDGAGQAWLVTGAEPRRVPALDDPAATLAAGVVLTSTTSHSASPVAPSPAALPTPASSGVSATPAPGSSSATAALPALWSSSATAALPTSKAPPVDAGTSGSGNPQSSYSAEIAARSVDGATLWITSGPVRVLGADLRTVLLLTPDNMLKGVDAQTGALKYSFPMTFPPDKADSTDWKPGLYHVTDGFLSMERLNRDAPDDPESPVYYLTLDAVLVTALPD